MNNLVYNGLVVLVLFPALTGRNEKDVKWALYGINEWQVYSREGTWRSSDRLFGMGHDHVVFGNTANELKHWK